MLSFPPGLVYLAWTALVGGVVMFVLLGRQLARLDRRTGHPKKSRGGRGQDKERYGLNMMRVSAALLVLSQALTLIDYYWP